MPNKFGEYEVLREIGKGSTSIVYLVKDNFGTLFALKAFDRLKLSEKDLKNLSFELEILPELKHPNIIEFQNSFKHQQFTCLNFKYYENKNLEEFLNNHPLSHSDIYKLFKQIVEAVSYLHTNRIIHRDIKLENIFVDENRNAILGDFGLSRRFFEDASFCGTPIFMAPELLARKNYDEKVDIWSLGITFYRMFYQDFPYDPQDIEDLQRQQLEPIVFCNQASETEKNVIMKMLQIDPQKRYSAQEILNDPIFSTDSRRISNNIPRNNSILSGLNETIRREDAQNIDTRCKEANIDENKLDFKQSSLEDGFDQDLHENIWDLELKNKIEMNSEDVIEDLGPEVTTKKIEMNKSIRNSNIISILELEKKGHYENFEGPASIIEGEKNKDNSISEENHQILKGEKEEECEPTIKFINIEKNHGYSEKEQQLEPQELSAISEVKQEGNEEKNFRKFGENLESAQNTKIKQFDSGTAYKERKFITIDESIFLFNLFSGFMIFGSVTIINFSNFFNCFNRVYF